MIFLIEINGEKYSVNYITCLLVLHHVNITVNEFFSNFLLFLLQILRTISAQLNDDITSIMIHKTQAGRTKFKNESRK